MLSGYVPLRHSYLLQILKAEAVAEAGPMSKQIRTKGE